MYALINWQPVFVRSLAGGLLPQFTKLAFGIFRVRESFRHGA